MNMVMLRRCSIQADSPRQKRIALQTERPSNLGRKTATHEMQFRLEYEVLPGQRTGAGSSETDDAPVEKAFSQENRSISGVVANRARGCLSQAEIARAGVSASFIG